MTPAAIRHALVFNAVARQLLISNVYESQQDLNGQGKAQIWRHYPTPRDRGKEKKKGAKGGGGG